MIPKSDESPLNEALVPYGLKFQKPGMPGQILSSDENGVPYWRDQTEEELKVPKCRACEERNEEEEDWI